MLTELLNILNLLKDLTYKKVFVILLSGIILITVWRFDTVIDYYIKLNSKSNDIAPVEKDKTKSNITIYSNSSDSGISEENMKEMQNIATEYLSKYADTFAISAFKFLPPGYEYAYQGRILILFKSKSLSEIDEQKLIKDLNINWIPIYSGKGSVEKLLDNLPVYLKYNPELNKFISTEESDFTPSSNLSRLAELGVKSIYRYPIIHDDRTVGYIAVYINKELSESEIAEFKRISSFLSSRLINYLNIRG